MKKILPLLLLTGIFIVIIFLSLNSLNFKTSIGHNSSIKTIKTVIFKKPKLKTFTKAINWFGEVKPLKNISIISFENGKIKKLFKNNGDYVKKGEKIAVISGEIDNKIKTLNFKINSFKEKIKIAKKDYEFKKKLFSNKLTRKDEVLLSKKELISLMAKLKIFVNQLNFLKLKKNIISPINGVFICDNHLTEGENILKGVSIGQVISSDIKIIGHVFVENIEKLKNKNVFINRLSFPITKILPYKDSSNRVIFWVKNKSLKKYFKIGDFISGKIVLWKRQYLSVPESAIIPDENGNKWIFVKEGKNFKKIKVEVGEIRDGYVQIISGISRDDNIVVKGGFELFYRDFSKSFKVED